MLLRIPRPFKSVSLQPSKVALMQKVYCTTSATNDVNHLQNKHIELIQKLKSLCTQSTQDPLDQMTQKLGYAFTNQDLPRQILQVQYNAQVPKILCALGRCVLKLLIVERLALATSPSDIPNMQLQAALSSAKIAQYAKAIGLQDIIPGPQIGGSPSDRVIADNISQIIACMYLDTEGDLFQMQSILNPALQGVEKEDADSQGDTKTDDISDIKVNLRLKLAKIPVAQKSSLTKADVQQIFPQKPDVFLDCFPMYVGKKAYDSEFMMTAFSTFAGWNKKMVWFGLSIIELVLTEVKAIEVLQTKEKLSMQELLDKKTIAQVAAELGLKDLIFSGRQALVDKQVVDLIEAAICALYVDGGGIHLPGGWFIQNILKQ
eukprot:TRINITY_DN13575_c0_g2_i1.p1 TRINITY_DN13575_c0_g2~~TRINITY_DN13575_c0_g2_i1.p1  ORF type:complete len:375 (+),score=22.01 TRINITY_DN13575_c0_g2_i1:338-1462(+)